MKRFLKMLGAFALCMGLLVSPVQAEKFVVGIQPYDTISYQAIINAELGLWKKYTPEGTVDDSLTRKVFKASGHKPVAPGAALGVIEGRSAADCPFKD